MKKNVLVIIGILLISNVSAKVIFEDDFDDHSDWSPTQNSGSGSQTQSQDGNYTTACTGCPDGAAKYSAYRIEHSAWSDWVGNNTLSISSTNSRSGKALTFWMEPINACNDQGGYCSDGQVAITLDQSYDGLYVRYYTKFQNNWVMDETNDNSAGKIFRISNFHSTGGSMWKFGCQNQANHWPLVFLDIKWPVHGGGGEREVIKFEPRYQNVYSASAATPAFSGSGPNLMDVYVGSDYTASESVTGSDLTLWEHLMDGNWHSIEVHVKGNTQGGYYSGSPNGIFEFWIDAGTAQEVHYIQDTMSWADDDDADSCAHFDGSTKFNGWNWVSFGGNFRNLYYSSDTHAEQWYAIDDIVISTEYIGPDYVGTNCSQADINSDNVVDATDLLAVIVDWKIGIVTMTNLMTAIDEWKNGC